MKHPPPQSACPQCSGTGKIPGSGTGVALRRMRVANNISMLDVARLMGFGSSYISDLERGKRDWTNDLVKNYENSLTRLCKH